MNEDVTILNNVISIKGTRGRLYYYQGNFYSPLIMKRREEARVDKAIRNFKYKHAKKIAKDRAKPDYKTILEIFDEQLPQSINN